VRRVYLPEGEQFFELGSRRAHEGGQTVELPVDEASVPVLVRAGGIVPMAGHRLTNLATQQVTSLHVVCAPQRDGQFDLFEDDGLTRAHETGAQLVTRIAMEAGAVVHLRLTSTGDYDSAVGDVLLDVIHPGRAPSWVELDGRRLPHLLDRQRFEMTGLGWYWSNTLGSVLVRYPNPRADHVVALSFEQVDLIGMDRGDLLSL
jgi:alpha-glucosidase